MPADTVYQQVLDLLEQHAAPTVTAWTHQRVALFVLGTIRAKSAAPAQVAQALSSLDLGQVTQASAESLERRIRRLENDQSVEAARLLHPLAAAHLRLGKPQRLVLVVDGSCQKDRLVLLSVAVRYRGRALPLVWDLWPANQPLQGARFWQRVEALLAVVAGLLPPGVPVIVVADRAFGTPAFTDRVGQHGWHFVVRVQGLTRVRDVVGREQPVCHLVRWQGGRKKCRGQVFKKQGWREASVVVLWGQRHHSPLCLVSDLPPDWSLVLVYRQRYSIEAGFRDMKSAGWQWEKGQVTDIEHVKRLLVCMAVATWVALFAGAQVAAEWLEKRPSGKRRSVPWAGKRSLFFLGVQRLNELLGGARWQWLHFVLPDWEAPSWQFQVACHQGRAFVFPHAPAAKATASSNQRDEAATYHNISQPRLPVRP